MTDEVAFEKAVKASGLKISDICDAMGISKQALCRKKSNEQEFNAKQIKAFKTATGCSDSDIVSIFLK